MEMKKGFMLHAFAVAAIAVICALLYAPTLEYGLVWDDDDILLREPIASGEKDWNEAFSVPVDRLYRPLRTLSFVFIRSIADTAAGNHGTVGLNTTEPEASTCATNGTMTSGHTQITLKHYHTLTRTVVLLIA